MSDQLGGLWFTLEAKSGQFMADMDAAEKRFEKTRQAAEKIGDTIKNVGIGMGVFGGAVLTAMGIAVNSLAKTADAFDEMSARTGVSVKALQELTYVSKLSGGSAESMEVAFKKMAMTITNAGEGMQQAKDQLKNLNLTFADLAGLSPEKQFNKLAGAISDIQDPTARAAAAVDIFGRSGTSLLPMLSGGREGLQKMRDEASVFSTVLDGPAAKAAAQLGDDIDRLTMGVKSLWDQVALALLPTVIEWVDKAKEIITETKKWIKENQDLFNNIVKIVGVVALVAVGFGTLLTVIGSIIAVAPLLGGAFMVLMGPVGIIIGAIAALVAAGWLLIKHWDAVKFYTAQAWEVIKGSVLSAILIMLEGLNKYLGWIPGFGNKLKGAMESVQGALLKTTENYEQNKSNYEAQQAAKALAKLKVEGTKTLAVEKNIQTQRKLSHEEMIQSLSASWGQFQQDYRDKTIDWYSELEILANGFQSSLSTGFNVMFTNITDGWSALWQGIQAFGNAIKQAVIQQLADMAAAWVMKHVIMSYATKAWGLVELGWNAAVTAARAAAANAWMLWGAIAVGAAMLAAVMGFAPKFATGGIVGGSSYAGDHVMAAVNSGEMILNSGQQAQLFAMANGAGGGGGMFVINANGPANREFARQIASELSREIYQNRKI
jgi:hypothetical protein